MLIATHATPRSDGRKKRTPPFGRGLTFALLDHTGSVEATILAIASAHGAGNHVLAVIHPAQKRHDESYLSTLDHVEWFFIPPENALSFIAASSLLKVVFATGDPALLDGLTRMAADRQGPLLPVITPPITPDIFFRFCTERTVTVDTTAACGNADLINMPTDTIT